MARMTRGSGGRPRGGPRWTRDDILRDAAEIFSLQPRPPASARRAFMALLGEFWPHVSEGTQASVEDVLRSSRHVCREVLETLDALVADAGVEASGLPTLIARAADVSHRDGLHVTATVTGAARAPVPVEERPAARITVAAPPLAHEPDVETDGALASSDVADPAEHARAVIARLATDEAVAAPALQPAEIEAQLTSASRPAPALATLLDVSPARAESILAVPRARGTAVALRALGVTPDLAERLVARWRGRAPGGFKEAYAALSLEGCLDTVSAWRRQDGTLRGAANGASAAGMDRRSA